MDVGPTELIIVLVIVLVLFGGKKLPEFARSLGKAKKEFQAGMDDGEAEADATSTTGVDVTKPAQVAEVVAPQPEADAAETPATKADG